MRTHDNRQPRHGKSSVISRGEIEKLLAPRETKALRPIIVAVTAALVLASAFAYFLDQNREGASQPDHHEASESGTLPPAKGAIAPALQ